MRRSKEASFKSLLQATRRSSSYLQNASQRMSATCPKPQGPIYDAIHDDLIASGFHTLAKYFKCIISKENELVQTDLKFKKRIRDARCLLMASIDNLKSAEETFLTTSNRELTLRLLIQTVHMIHAQGDVFRWVVKEIYRIILRIGGDWEGDACREMVARTRFEYGLVLSEMGGTDVDEAIHQMSTSLTENKGRLWYTNDKDRNILQDDCCVELCQLLLQRAENVAKTDPGRAVDFACRAVSTFLEVGIGIDIDLYCVANLRQAEYMIASADYDGALKVLSSVQAAVMPNEVPRNKCEFYLLLGVCYFSLNQNKLALRKLTLSLRLSENYDIPDLKAKALLYCGKIHAKETSSQQEARECFMAAKELFKTLKDIENEKLAKYLVAKLKTYQIFPAYIELMKQASCAGFCYFFSLLNWKQKMLPFWTESLTLPQQEDELSCLMKEDIGSELPAGEN